jgi:hypothetical protein
MQSGKIFSRRTYPIQVVSAIMFAAVIAHLSSAACKSGRPNIGRSDLAMRWQRYFLFSRSAALEGSTQFVTPPVLSTK